MYCVRFADHINQSVVVPPKSDRSDLMNLT